MAAIRAVALTALACTAVACVSVVPDPPEATSGSLRFVAESGIATVQGRFASWRVADARIDPSDVAGSYVEIEIDVASIETGIDARDEHVRDPDFFEVDRWPSASVRVHSAEPSGEPGRYDAHFDVRIRDVSRTLEGRFEVVSEKPLIVAGELVIDRLLFGVGDAPSRWNPLDVDRAVPVSFRVTLE
jgi:polyisoprenoid-binding protein YceI